MSKPPRSAQPKDHAAQRSRPDPDAADENPGRCRPPRHINASPVNPHVTKTGEENYSVYNQSPVIRSNPDTDHRIEMIPVNRLVPNEATPVPIQKGRSGRSPTASRGLDSPIRS